MISEEQIQLKNKAEFYKVTKELTAKILEARKEKKSSRVLTKLVKEGSFELIEEAEKYENLSFLVDEAARLKIAEKNKDLVQLKELQEEVAQVVAEVDSEFEKGMNKTKAREYIKKLLELRVNIPRFAELKETLEKPSKRGRKKTVTKEEKSGAMSLEDFGKLVSSDLESNEELQRTVKKKLIQNKELFLELVEGFNREVECDLPEFDFDKVSGWMKALKKTKIEIEGLETLELRYAVFGDLRFVADKLFKRGDMEVEGENEMERVRRGMENSLENELREKTMKDVVRRLDGLDQLMKENDIESEVFSEIMKLVPSVQWAQSALHGLKKKKTKRSVLENLVENAPENLKSGSTYKQLVSKVEGRDIVFNEADIHSKVVQFLDEDGFVELGDKIEKFIQDCKAEKIEEKSKQLLNLFKKILDFYTSENFKGVDGIVEEMFVHKLYETRAFKKLEKVQKTIETMNRQRGQIIASKNKLSRNYQNLVEKKMNPLSILKNISRLNIQSAKKILKQFNSLQKGIKSVYTSNIQQLTQDIEASVGFGDVMKEFRKKYPLSKLNDGIEGSKLDGLIKEFEELIHSYCNVNFSTVSITKEIDSIAWLIKALSLLDGKTYYNCDKSLNSWKKVYTHIEGNKGKVVKAFRKKIEIAHNFEKQVREIKSSLGKTKSDSEKKLSLQGSRKILEKLETECSEIDLGNLKVYFDGVIAGIQSRLNSIKNDDQMMLHELQNHLEFFKRAPLEMELEIKPLIEKEAKANQFLQMVRQLSPETFVLEQKSLQDQYKDLGIKVMEWEDMTSSVEKEEEVLKEINASLETGIGSLNQCSQLRDKYKTFIKFMTDLKVETQLMNFYLQLLRSEFERKQDSINSSDEKACIDFIVLSALVTEIEQLVFRLKTDNHSFKQELQDLAEHAQFATDLFSDVKRHLEYNIFGVDLATLDSNPPSKVFKSFVDITGPILDYKINLQINEREAKEKQKSLFPYKDTHRKTALVLESKLERPSQMSAPFKSKQESKPKLDKKKEANGARKRRYNKQSDILQNKPPVSRNEVTQDLRNYYWKNWKSLMEQNEHLDISGLDALMASKSLEKAIYDRIKRSPLDYDVLCTSITNTLRHIVGLRNISNHLRNEAFKPNVLLLYCDKPLVHLRSLDRNFKGGSGGRNDGEKFDRKASNFNPKQQKGMPVSRQAYKEPGFGKMMEPETSTVEEISYKHYKIYQGKMTFEISKKKKKSLDGIDLISCSSYEGIVKFSQIPRKVNLKTSVSQNDFAKFISSAISQPKKYSLLTGWVSYSKGHKNAANYFKKNGCVASNQYSKTCKIFVFPIEALDSRWLTQIPIYTTTSKIEMLFMLVLKRKSGSPVDVMITPEPQPILTPNAYRIIPGHGSISLKPSNLDRIKERTRITITGRFDDTPHRYSDRSAQKGPIKAPSKLQNLLDRAGEIEKVPEELIEQENKLRERKALQIDAGYSTNNELYKGTIAGSLNKERVSLGMDTLLRKRPVVQQRSSFLHEPENDEPGYAMGAIDKNEFIKNAVNSIQLPPTHTFFGGGVQNPINGYGGQGFNGNVF